MTNEQRAEALIKRYEFNFTDIPKQEIRKLIEKEISDFQKGSSEYIRLLCGYLHCIGDPSDADLIEKAKYGIKMDVGCMIDGEWIDSLKGIEDECKADKICRIVKGQHILPDDMEDELLSISKRSKNVIFSHETALFLHGISDRTPFEHAVTAPSGCIPSTAIQSACKVYYIKPELFEMGKTTLKTPAGNLVPCYDLERTLCDCIRSRNKLGTETFLAALKLYAASPKKDLNKLSSYAKQLRVANVLRPYLEVLL